MRDINTAAAAVQVGIGPSYFEPTREIAGHATRSLELSLMCRHCCNAIKPSYWILPITDGRKQIGRSRCRSHGFTAKHPRRAVCGAGSTLIIIAVDCLRGAAESPSIS